MSSNYLTAEQVNQLLAPINPRRVLARDGMAYVAAHDIKAHLNRLFGFGRWSSEVVEQGLVFEQQVTMRNGKDGWYVCYRSVVRLTVCAPDGTVLAVYTEGHVGDNTGPTRGDVHGNAVANSESYALKRCAAMLGDQFGLSLYEKGSKAAFVRGTLVHPEAPKGDVEGAEVTSDGNDERDQTTTPEPPAASPQAPAPAATLPAEPPQAVGVQELRERVLTALKVTDKSKALKALIDVQLAASKSKQLQAPTTTPAGDDCTVAELIATAQKLVSGRDQNYRPKAAS